MKREMIVMMVFMVSLGAVYVANSVHGAVAAEKKKLLRVGVYDSRGIAIAYAHSHFNEAWYQDMKAQLDAAQAAGDEQKINELKAAGKAEQARKHLQGFGTAPVHDYLEIVKNKIQTVAETTGVDVVVSNWEIDYLADDADVVDVTMELAKLFEPGEKAYQWIEQLHDKEPLSHEQLKRLEEGHTH